MLSRSKCVSLSAGRRRLCQAASVIAVCLLGTGVRASVQAGTEDASLRGALHKTVTEETPLPENPEVNDVSPRDGEDDMGTLPQEVICDTAGTKQAVIRSKKDGVNLRCKEGFAVYDIPNVGEVFGPDCKSPKNLEDDLMKAVLDHSVDDIGAFRTMSISRFPSEDEQFCIVCALEEDAVSAGAKETPLDQVCSVIVTVVGTNNKDHVPEDATPEKEQVPEQLSEEPAEAETKNQEGHQPGSTAQLLEARSSQQPTRQQRTGQHIAPRQPQQQVEQQPGEEISQDDGAEHDHSPSPVSTDEQGAEQGSKPEEQQEEGAQVHGHEKPTEEKQKVESDDENPVQTEDSDSTEEKETTNEPLQCMNVDLHLDITAGESVSFTCGDKQQLTPDTGDLVYEESEGKCGTVSKSISDLVPEAEITTVDGATVVAVAFGDSEEKTVCYRCVKQEDHEEIEETETEGETAAGQLRECEVFITLKPGLAASARVASSASTPSSSFLLSTVVFLGALLCLL